MHTEINGKSYEFEELHPDETAVEVIRERAGLTGTKLVCGAGVCGACTVRLDGQPVTSCLLPAHRLNGRSLQTVEGIGPDLHPVQKAFMACDALQCGFCTPGFIVEGVAFYERWRAEHGKATPSREEIAQAFAGHLCRCGAYPSIYTAMQQACAGEFDDVDEVEPPRVEAAEKVTGRAKYTVDVHDDDQLEGHILRSPHAHASVLLVDAAEARALPGVHAVVELLDDDRTARYLGQPILAVAAENGRIARKALEIMRVTYDVKPAVIGMDAARADDAPTVYDGLIKNAPSSAEGMLVPGTWNGNVRTPVVTPTASKGRRARKRVEKAQAQGWSNFVEGTWHTAAQSHTTLEPHACVAYWRDDDQLIVHLSTQACDLMAREIAGHFGLPREQVQVLCQHVGGGFGAKLAMTEETIAAISLSRETRCPVRVAFDRLEELAYGGFRPAAELNVAMLANPEGNLSALSAEVYGDGGIAIGSTVAALMGFIYADAPKHLADHDVVNHTPPGKPFRGPGGPVACWALEQAVDDMAHQLGEDPLALRRRWDPDPLRQKLYDWAETIPAWRERGKVAGDNGRFRRGIGVAIGAWFYFFHADTEVEVSATAAGIAAQTAAQDMGNGTRTVIARAVGGVFGIPPTAVTVRIGDSHAVRGPLSGGSRTTNSVHVAAQAAAEQVRDKLLAAANERLGLQKPVAADGGIRHTDGHLPWADVWRQLEPVTAVAARGRDPGLPAVPLAFGADGLTTGRGNTGAVHVSEVEVDTRLGKIRPLRVWGGLAVGKIVAPALARSQCEGGIVQGIGYALYEERQVDPRNGRILSLGLEDYRIPGIGDVPEIEIHFIEEGFEHAKGGGVGLGELSTLAVAASIGNAVYHATGWRPYELPIRPQRLLEGLSQ